MKTMGRAKSLVIVALLIGLPLAAFSLYLLIKSAERRRWHEMRVWCEQVAQEARARDPRRPVLRGVPVEGNAWDDYHAALASLGASTKDLHLAADYFYDRPKASVEKTRATVELHAGAFQALRRGVSRSFAERKVDWENPSDTVPGKLNLFAILAGCKARFLMEDGRGREAMELLLDTAQYGEDAALNGTVIDGLMGIAVLSTVMEELKRFLAPGRLSREDCRELARVLELLDQGFPREADAYAIEPMSTGFWYLQKGSIRAILEQLGWTKPDAAPTWRYGFSERLVIADAFSMDRLWSRRLAEAAGKPWNEARQIQADLDTDRRETKNPLVKVYSHIQETLSDRTDSVPRNAFRDCRAQLRLIRGVAAHRATGLIPHLVDPYGDKIRTSMTGTTLKLWSVGGDGVDDGGTGEWDGRKGKDIILEVER